MTSEPVRPPFPPRCRHPAPTRRAVASRCSTSRSCPPGAMRRVTRGELDVLLAHTPTGIVATDDRCPHMSAPLSIGELEGCVVACPLHEGRFDLCSGDAVQMPTTGGLDADGVYHPTWSPAGSEPKVDPPGQEGRGAPADPRPAVPLLPGPDRRRQDRGRDPGLSRGRVQLGLAPARRPRLVGTSAVAAAASTAYAWMIADGLLGVVGQAEQVEVCLGDRRRRAAAARSSRASRAQ